MYYYGYFRDTDTSTDRLGNLYKVVIITNFTKQEYEVGENYSLVVLLLLLNGLVKRIIYLRDISVLQLQ